MSTVIRSITRAYGLLVRLYPRAFRAEFGEEMRAVFAEVVAEAAGYGRMALIGVSWRELRDCPRNLLSIHWQSLHDWMKEVFMPTGSNSTPGVLRGDESLVQALAALLSRNAVLKRSFDILIAGFFLVVTAPLFAVIAALVKLDSPGPAIFRQQRVGGDGQPYTMHKFRSMACDVEGIRAPAPGERDPRLTRVGRFIRRLYLDELPQLFNVLKGEMSVFGPHPELAQ